MVLSVYISIQLNIGLKYKTKMYLLLAQEPYEVR